MSALMEFDAAGNMRSSRMTLRRDSLSRAHDLYRT